MAVSLRYARNKRDSPAFTPRFRFASSPVLAEPLFFSSNKRRSTRAKTADSSASGSVSATRFAFLSDSPPRMSRTSTPAMAADTSSAGASREGSGKPVGMSPFLSNASLMCSASTPGKKWGFDPVSRPLSLSHWSLREENTLRKSSSISSMRQSEISLRPSTPARSHASSTIHST